jgi:prephenate dehydrogenase
MVVRMTPEEHDQALAVTSHLPHVAAVVLATTLPERFFRLCSSGMLDTTRIASGDPELWRQILEMNRDNVLTALEQYGSKLASLHAAIRDGNQAEITRFLTLAKKNRDALGS